MFAIIIAQLHHLRRAFSREATFLWICLFIVGLCVAHDNLGGVSPTIRALGLDHEAYLRVLNSLHSSAINFELLVKSWHGLILKLFGSNVVTLNGRPVYLADAIKNPKEGRRMPAVKKQHQESMNNSKPEYIRGHFIQAIGVLVRGLGGSTFCLPFIAKIHEGFKLRKDDTRTLKTKFKDLVLELPISGGVLVCDAWYAAAKIISFVPKGFDLVIITRVGKTSVATRPPFPEKGRRGRPRKYGEKVLLSSLFATAKMFDGQVTGANGEILAVQYWCEDLLWRSLGVYVRFVGMHHPDGRRFVTLCTDVSMPPLDIIQGYTYRFRIEIAFKVGVHTMRTFGYRFWTKTIDKLPRFPVAEMLFNRPDDYVARYLLKIRVYEIFMLTGFIAQGLLAYLSVFCPVVVRSNLRTWFRTIRTGLSLSETIVAESLRTEIPNLMKAGPRSCAVTKFIAEQIVNAQERINIQLVQAKTG